MVDLITWFATNYFSLESF